MTPEQIFEHMRAAGLTDEQVDAVCDITIKAGNTTQLSDAFRFIKYELLPEKEATDDAQEITQKINALL